jgi:hypothetical protein
VFDDDVDQTAQVRTFGPAQGFDFLGDVGPVQVGVVDKLPGGAAAQQVSLVFGPQRYIGVVQVAHRLYASIGCSSSIVIRRRRSINAAGNSDGPGRHQTCCDKHAMVWIGWMPYPVRSRTVE